MKRTDRTIEEMGGDKEYKLVVYRNGGEKQRMGERRRGDIEDRYYYREREIQQEREREREREAEGDDKQTNRKKLNNKDHDT